jgi:hypothetical protein
MDGSMEFQLMMGCGFRLRPGIFFVMIVFLIVMVLIQVEISNYRRISF